MTSESFLAFAAAGARMQGRAAGSGKGFIWRKYNRTLAEYKTARQTESRGKFFLDLLFGVAEDGLKSERLFGTGKFCGKPAVCCGLSRTRGIASACSIKKWERRQ
jgi:hypothetical protein